MTTPHDLLGLRPGAAAEEVQAAWRRMARDTHPDRGGDPEQFRLAQQAYRDLQPSVSRPRTRPPTVVRRMGPATLASRWWRRRSDRVRRPRVH